MNGECFKCHQRGHFATSCPYNQPAADIWEHMARIELFIGWWVAGRLTRQEKRLAISTENEMFYGPQCPRQLLIT